MLPLIPPMPLASVSAPFDDLDWLFEPKWDGFRALAYIDGGRCRLVSRRGHVYKSWPQLAEDLSHAVQAGEAVLDGEICCLAADGRSDFYDLLFRRSRPHFMAFDVLWVEGQDLRNRPLRDRKRMLTRVLPKTGSSVRLVQHIEGRGCDLFRAACDRDLAGIVAKWRGGTYQPGPHTSWLKIRNLHYSQWEGRRELFEARRDNAQRRARKVKPQVMLR